MVDTSKPFLTITCQNFSRDSRFFNPNGTLADNSTKILDYQQTNLPDLLLTTRLIQTGNVLAWSQVWNNQISVNTINPKCNPFLKQVGFNTWDCKYLFDGSLSTIEYNNENFSTARVSHLSFQIKIPSNYDIQNPAQYTTKTDSTGAFIISKDIMSGEIFQLTITDSNLESTRILLSAFSYLGFASIVASIIVGLILDYFQRK